MPFSVDNTQRDPLPDCSRVEVDDGKHHWEILVYSMGAFAGKLSVKATVGQSIVNRLINPGFQKKVVIK